MEIEKERVKKRIRESQEYGLKLSQLAREIELQPISIYKFLDGNINLSKVKQIQAVSFIEKYMDTVKELQAKGYILGK